MNAEYDKNHATKDGHGNVIANDQNGVDAKGRPRKSDSKSWRFGDSLAGITPEQTADAVVAKAARKFHIDAAKHHLHAAKAIKTT